MGVGRIRAGNGSRVGGEAPDRWLTRASLRSPASAWSSNSPNALYPSSLPEPHRMTDGGSLPWSRRDFCLPFLNSSENQILLLFSPRRPSVTTTAPDKVVPLQWQEVLEPLCSHCFCPGQGGGAEPHPNPAPQTWPSQAEAVCLHRP